MGRESKVEDTSEMPTDGASELAQASEVEPVQNIDEALCNDADALPLILSRLPLPEQCRAAEVNRVWRDASERSLAAATAINLRPYASMTDEHVAALLRRTPNVRSLNLSGCTKLTDAALEAICSCPLLVDINLTCLHQITADGVSRMTAATPHL